MQRVLLSLSLLASAAFGVLAADELKIDVTVPVECDRKTQKGDKIDVHYRGTLLSNGQEFDASQYPTPRIFSIFWIFWCFAAQ
jgi:FK506-binding protein 2